MSAIFEDKPRWTGAPPICVAENRLAFDGDKAIKEFVVKNCPRHSVVKQWLCKSCGKLHFTAVVHNESGLLGQYPEWWKPVFVQVEVKEKRERRKPEAPLNLPKETKREKQVELI